MSDRTPNTERKIEMSQKANLLSYCKRKLTNSQPNHKSVVILRLNTKGIGLESKYGDLRIQESPSLRYLAHQLIQGSFVSAIELSTFSKISESQRLSEEASSASKVYIGAFSIFVNPLKQILYFSDFGVDPKTLESEEALLAFHDDLQSLNYMSQLASHPTSHQLVTCQQLLAKHTQTASSADIITKDCLDALSQSLPGLVSSSITERELDSALMAETALHAIMMAQVCETITNHLKLELENKTIVLDEELRDILWHGSFDGFSYPAKSGSTDAQEAANPTISPIIQTLSDELHQAVDVQFKQLCDRFNAKQGSESEDMCAATHQWISQGISLKLVALCSAYFGMTEALNVHRLRKTFLPEVTSVSRINPYLDMLRQTPKKPSGGYGYGLDSSRQPAPDFLKQSILNRMSGMITEYAGEALIQIIAKRSTGKEFRRVHAFFTDFGKIVYQVGSLDLEILGCVCSVDQVQQFLTQSSVFFVQESMNRYSTGLGICFECLPAENLLQIPYAQALSFRHIRLMRRSIVSYDYSKIPDFYSGHANGEQNNCFPIFEKSHGIQFYADPNLPDIFHLGICKADLIPRLNEWGWAYHLPNTVGTTIKSIEDHMARSKQVLTTISNTMWTFPNKIIFQQDKCISFTWQFQTDFDEPAAQLHLLEKRWAFSAEENCSRWFFLLVSAGKLQSEVGRHSVLCQLSNSANFIEKLFLAIKTACQKKAAFLRHHDRSGISYSSTLETVADHQILQEKFRISMSSTVVLQCLSETAKKAFMATICQAELPRAKIAIDALVKSLTPLDQTILDKCTIAYGTDLDGILTQETQISTFFLRLFDYGLIDVLCQMREKVRITYSTKQVKCLHERNDSVDIDNVFEILVELSEELNKQSLANQGLTRLQRERAKRALNCLLLGYTPSCLKLDAVRCALDDHPAGALTKMTTNTFGTAQKILQDVASSENWTIESSQVGPFEQIIKNSKATAENRVARMKHAVVLLEKLSSFQPFAQVAKDQQ